MIIDAIYNKLETYWNRHLSNSSSISAILDPRYKIIHIGGFVHPRLIGYNKDFPKQIVLRIAL